MYGAFLEFFHWFYLNKVNKLLLEKPCGLVETVSVQPHPQKKYHKISFYITYLLYNPHKTKAKVIFSCHNHSTSFSDLEPDEGASATVMRRYSNVNESTVDVFFEKNKYVSLKFHAGGNLTDCKENCSLSYTTTEILYQKDVLLDGCSTVEKALLEYPERKQG